MIVAAVVAVVLVLAWRSDRRRRAHHVLPPENDVAVGHARVETYRRRLDGLGPSRGP
jgi:hypothetical protein